MKTPSKRGKKPFRSQLATPLVREPKITPRAPIQMVYIQYEVQNGEVMFTLCEKDRAVECFADMREEGCVAIAVHPT